MRKYVLGGVLFLLLLSPWGLLIAFSYSSSILITALVCATIIGLGVLIRSEFAITKYRTLKKLLQKLQNENIKLNQKIQINVQKTRLSADNLVLIEENERIKKENRALVSNLETVSSELHKLQQAKAQDLDQSDTSLNGKQKLHEQLEKLEIMEAKLGEVVTRLEVMVADESSFRAMSENIEKILRSDIGEEEKFKAIKETVTHYDTISKITRIAMRKSGREDTNANSSMIRKMLGKDKKPKPLKAKILPIWQNSHVSSSVQDLPLNVSCNTLKQARK